MRELFSIIQLQFDHLILFYYFERYTVVNKIYLEKYEFVVSHLCKVFFFFEFSFLLSTWKIDSVKHAITCATAAAVGGDVWIGAIQSRRCGSCVDGLGIGAQRWFGWIRMRRWIFLHAVLYGSRVHVTVFHELNDAFGFFHVSHLNRFRLQENWRNRLVSFSFGLLRRLKVWLWLLTLAVKFMKL